MRAIAGLLVVVSFVFVGSGTATADDTALKALLITGGCCHDYTLQTEILEAEIAKRANVDWTVVNQGGTTKDTKIPIYDDPKWADGYDVVVHNECFADVLDEKWIAARVFGTTFGHSNETFQDSVFLDTFARGLLWAAGPRR